MRDRKFLGKDDIGNGGKGSLLTVRSVTQENVAMTGAPPEMKWCLHFHEEERPMVLNSINAQLIAGFLGSEETEDWTGHKIVLYVDPTIVFGGKLVGGIRARAPRLPAAQLKREVLPVIAPPVPAQAPAAVAGVAEPAAAESFGADDDVPF